MLGLPMIVNRKTVDPTDSSSPEVLQLETAMGAAIGVFEGAAAMRVPRTRFAPVKTTNQLLVVRSDAYELADDWTVRARRRDPIPVVELDADALQAAGRVRARFPGGAALAAVVRAAGGRTATSASAATYDPGTVRLEGPLAVEDGAVLEGSGPTAPAARGASGLRLLLQPLAAQLLGLAAPQHPHEQRDQDERQRQRLLDHHDHAGHVLVLDRR